MFVIEEFVKNIFCYRKLKNCLSRHLISKNLIKKIVGFKIIRRIDSIGQILPDSKDFL